MSTEKDNSKKESTVKSDMTEMSTPYKMGIDPFKSDAAESDVAISTGKAIITGTKGELDTPSDGIFHQLSDSPIPIAEYHITPKDAVEKAVLDSFSSTKEEEIVKNAAQELLDNPLLPGREFLNKPFKEDNMPSKLPTVEESLLISDKIVYSPSTGAIIMIDMRDVPKAAQDITSLDIMEFLKERDFSAYRDIRLINDGSHSFDQLYECQHALFIAFCHSNKVSSWKSKVHSDGKVMEGWFILGFRKNPGNQITFHLPGRYWDSCNVQELETAPEFDGHTTYDVIERLMTIR